MTERWIDYAGIQVLLLRHDKITTARAVDALAAEYSRSDVLFALARLHRRGAIESTRWGWRLSALGMFAARAELIRRKTETTETTETETIVWAD